jgi:hypothetical protein
MRKPLAIAAVLAALSGAVVMAQQATNNTPVSRPAEDNRQIVSYYATSDGGGRWEVYVAIRDSGNNEIRRESYSGPDAAHPAATASAFNTAVINARASETGTDVRKVRFRITGFLFDNGYLPSTTLVP